MVGPSGQGGIEIHLDEAGFVIRLHLRDAVHVGADDRSDHRVAAARYGVPVQDDRLEPRRHLDRTIRITGVHDVGRIGTRSEGLLALLELEWPALLVAIADAIGFRRHGPRILEEGLFGLVGEAMEIQAGHHAQFEFLGQWHREPVWDAPAELWRALVFTDWHDVARLEFAPLESTERAQPVG